VKKEDRHVPKQRVVITRKVPEPLASMLQQQFEVAMHDGTDPLEPQQLQAFVRGALAIVSIADDKMTGEICDAAGPQLKIIANYAVGYDNVDLAAAIARKIWVTHTPGVENSAVCELTFGLALTLMRGIIRGDALVRTGKFAHWDAFTLVGPELDRSTLGIIGLGQIGSAVAERAKAFGMRVLYFDVMRKHKLEEAIGVEYVAREEVFARADVVTLHVPLTPETRHLVTRTQLELMKPTAYLLNLCRGPVVDEAALVQALQRKRIAGAGLDLYEHEPHLTPGLAELENVVLTPHLGSSTVPAREAMGRLVAESVRAALTGRTPPNRVEGT
jgi:glyoxylate reductase